MLPCVFAVMPDIARANRVVKITTIATIVGYRHYRKYADDAHV